MSRKSWGGKITFSEFYGKKSTKVDFSAINEVNYKTIKQIATQLTNFKVLSILCEILLGIKTNTTLIKEKELIKFDRKLFSADSTLHLFFDTNILYHHGLFLSGFNI